VGKTTAIPEEEGAEAVSPWKKRAAGVLAAVLLTLFALYPAQFKLHPDCQVVPVQINYVAPRFDGLLQKVFVEPGDRVSEGEQLAALDGRELEMELRSVQADSAKALKQRDNHLANGNVAAAQIGLLEYKRLQERAKLLRMRKEQLALSSPVDGIVLSGDLKKAEGSPVSKGQVLFELAPLTTILIALAVADADIAHVQEKNPVTVRFDAFPGRNWQGEIDHISPKSALLQGQNVFVVTFELDNGDNLLQPGMRGQASVQCGRRSLLWIYFHKPWYALVRLFNSLL
jgi:RND family efflux transporter MFP subunit